jgi:hypothetical protein
VQNENCHLSFAIPKKQHEPFFNSPCQINHCPTPSAQNNMILQTNQIYYLPMKIQFSKSLLNHDALNNLNEDYQASFSPW